MSMERNRPQLSRDELQQLRWLLGGVLTLISVWTVWYLEIDAWVLAGITTGAVLVTLARPDLPARLPPRVHKLAFPFIVAFFLWDLYSTAQWLPAVIRLDILLLLYRGSSYRKKRDDLQIIVLGLFLITVAGVLTVSLAFAVQILVFTATTLAFLFVITLAESAEGGLDLPATAGGGQPELPAAPKPGSRPAWTEVHWRKLARRLRMVADWRVLALGGALFVGVVAVSALLFLAIPRFQLDSGFFLDRFISKKSRTGFSDSIRLGDVIDIQQDNSVALRVDVSDPARVPAMPYWRMVVLDEYRDGQLRTSRRLRNELTLSAQTTSVVRDQLRTPPGPPVSWTFYLESGISRFLPLGGPFTVLRFREPQQVQSQRQLRMFALRNEPVTMTAYRIEGMVADGFVPDRSFGAALRKAQQGATESRPARPDTDDSAAARPAGRPAGLAANDGGRHWWRQPQRRGVFRTGAALVGGEARLLSEGRPAGRRPGSGGGVDGVQSARPLRTVHGGVHPAGAGCGIPDARGHGIQGRRLERLRKLFHGTQFAGPRLV
jgi:hypothetical protein